jgi:hypothetical protein
MSTSGRKQLGQSRPANTTAVSIYSPGADIEARIYLIIITNTTGSDTTFRIFHDEDGTTYNETTALYFDQTITANNSAILIFDNTGQDGIAMETAAGNLAVRTGTNDALTFTVYGSELDKIINA